MDDLEKLYRIYPCLRITDTLTNMLLASERQLRRAILKVADDAQRRGLDANDAEFLAQRRNSLAEIFDHFGRERRLFDPQRIAALAAIEAAFMIGSFGKDQDQVTDWRATLAHHGGEARGKQKKEAAEKWRRDALREANSICRLGVYVTQDDLTKKIIEKLWPDGAGAISHDYIKKLIRLWEKQNLFTRPKRGS